MKGGHLAWLLEGVRMEERDDNKQKGYLAVDVFYDTQKREKQSS